MSRRYGKWREHMSRRHVATACRDGTEKCREQMLRRHVATACRDGTASGASTCHDSMSRWHVATARRDSVIGWCYDTGRGAEHMARRHGPTAWPDGMARRHGHSTVAWYDGMTRRHVATAWRHSRRQLVCNSVRKLACDMWSAAVDRFEAISKHMFICMSTQM